MEEAPPDLPEGGGDKLASSLLRRGGIGTPLLSEGLGEASLPPSGELEGASLPLSLRRGGWGVRLFSTNSLLSLLAVPLPMAMASILYVLIILCRASVACLT